MHSVREGICMFRSRRWARDEAITFKYLLLSLSLSCSVPLSVSTCVTAGISFLNIIYDMQVYIIISARNNKLCVEIVSHLHLSSCTVHLPWWVSGQGRGRKKRSRGNVLLLLYYICARDFLLKLPNSVFSLTQRTLIFFLFCLCINLLRT